MAKLGTHAPLAGFLTDATQVDEGGTFSIDGLDNPRLEPEVAVRLRAAIPPNATPREILAAVDAVAPAIEIIDMGPTDDLEALLAGNIFHRAYLIGQWAEAMPTTFSETRVNIQIGDTDVQVGVDPTQLLGRLEDILGGIARQLPLAGAGLEAGDVVITGSVITALQLTGGEVVRVALVSGESVSVTIEPTR